MSYFIHLILLSLGMLVFLRILLSNNRRYLKYAGTFVLNFGLRLFLIYMNQHFNFFQTKLEGQAAVNLQKVFLATGHVSIHSTFFLQWLVSFPFFELNGPTFATILIDNAFVGAVVPMGAAYFMYKLYGSRFENYTLFLFSFFPSFISFSIFGLRDIIILAVVTANALASLYMFQARKKSKQFYKAAFVYGGTVFLILFIRPEMSVLLALPFFFYLLRGILVIVKRLSDNYSRVLVLSTLAGLFLLVGASFLYFANHFLISNIGGTGGASVSKIMKVYAQQRYQRQIQNGGGGSAIVHPATYHHLSIGGRLGVQILGMVVIPFPWEIKSITKLLAFGDTLVVLFLLFHLLRYYYRQFKSKRVGLRRFMENPFNVLGLTFFCCVMIYGILVVNFGNAFRLRMSILPYLIFPAIFSLVIKKSVPYAP